jgi:hypothetical protein
MFTRFLLCSTIAALATGTCGTPHSVETGTGGTTTPPGPAALWEDITPAGVSLADTIGVAPNCGMQNVVVDPSTPTTVYLSTCYQGIWKSIDSGLHWSRVNTGRNGDAITAGRAWTLAIDAVAPQTLYTTSGYGALGIWKSTNGGVDWDQLFAPGNPTESINWAGGYLPDIYAIDIDPADHNHLIATFHDAPWKGYSDAGLIETMDGGATWTLHQPAAGMGSSQYAFFLGDSATWIIVGSAPASGTWRRTSAGTFQRVSDNYNVGGGCQIYRARNAFYHTGDFGVFRSTDNGATWTNVASIIGRNTMGLVGDGVHIYASDALVESSPFNPTLFAPENPGDTGWAVYGDQQLASGGRWLSADVQGHIIYSANMRSGVFRLVTQ